MWYQLRTGTGSPVSVQERVAVSPSVTVTVAAEGVREGGTAGRDRVQEHVN